MIFNRHLHVFVVFAFLAPTCFATNDSDCDDIPHLATDESGFFQSKLMTRFSETTRISLLSSDDCPASLPIKCPDGICLEKGRQCAAQWYQALRKSKTGKVESSASNQNVVALTYCDAGFASIWPTFISCYKQAFGCAPDVGPEACGSSKPKLLDLGLSHQPGQSGTHCSHTGMPAWTKSKSLLELTPTGVPTLIATNILEQLSAGKDVLRLDADAFLLDDPMQIFLKFPDVDIISSPDFVDPKFHGNWYSDEKFKSRHPSDDPFATWGFMMNTGLTYIRSNTKTIRLVRAATKALASGQTTFEQIALNEELADLGCKWSEPERLPSGGNASQNWHVLVTTPLMGECFDDFKVVVLPYYDMTRSLEQAPRAISMHAGNNKTMESRAVATMCNSREKLRNSVYFNEAEPPTTTTPEEEETPDEEECDGC